jgi:hypothetical protein
MDPLKSLFSGNKNMILTTPVIKPGQIDLIPEIYDPGKMAGRKTIRDPFRRFNKRSLPVNLPIINLGRLT